MSDPFGGRFGSFGGFGGRFGSFGGFGASRSSLFGGRDPFDDPFFSQQFEDLVKSNMFSSGASFSNPQKNNGGRGLTIEELPSDEELEEEDDTRNEEERGISESQPSIEHPEDDADGERKLRNVSERTYFNKSEGTQSRSHTFRHHTSKVTYGGIDGAYYTSSRTRRAGSDGIVVEESKEADMSTGEATHKISRGINDKGHSVTRKLNPGGLVNTTQTLHNLDEDELSSFEEAWKGNSSGWTGEFDKHEPTGSNHRLGGWLLPSLDQTNRRTFQNQTGPCPPAPGAKKVVRINIE